MAILLHLGGFRTTDQVVRMVEERMDLRRFANSVRQHVRGLNQPMTIALLDEREVEELEDSASKPKQPVDKTETEAAAEKDEESSKNDEEKPLKADELKPDQLPPEEKKKPEPEKPKVEKKDDTETEQQFHPDKRISIVQHVKDKNQKDNPEAKFRANEANHVAEETQARITSTDQNDPKPTPGRTYAGPNEDPGNAEETEVAHSEERFGERNLAPTDTSESPQKLAIVRVTPRSQPAPAPAPAPRPEQAAQRGQKAQAAVEDKEAVPETLDARGGSFDVPEQRTAQAAAPAKKARKHRLFAPKRSRRPLDFLGLGSTGTTSRGINLNLSQQDALAIVGADQLRHHRQKDAERRLSQHRGSWKNLGLERWRAAIENYVPSIKPGNQTALNAARAPWASYLNTIHNRLHPIFAWGFLDSLDSQPASSRLNDMELKTYLEIVLSKEDGRVVRMGVTRTSGITVFDIGALESVQRAEPFGTPPKQILSPDGHAYLHWEFHRNPIFACSTYYAHPYIKKLEQRPAPPRIDPPLLPPAKERGPADDGRRGQYSPKKPATLRQPRRVETARR